MAVTAVEGGLAGGMQLQRWQVDGYPDEPYCANFRGDLNLPIAILTFPRGAPPRLHKWWLRSAVPAHWARQLLQWRLLPARIAAGCCGVLAFASHAAMSDSLRAGSADCR